MSSEDSRDDELPIRERSPEAQRAYLDGVRAGVDIAAGLAAIYEGQSDLKGRIVRAGNGMVDVMGDTLNSEATS